MITPSNRTVMTPRVIRINKPMVFQIPELSLELGGGVDGWFKSEVIMAPQLLRNILLIMPIYFYIDVHRGFRLSLN
jgi:hypothetical protein